MAHAYAGHENARPLFDVIVIGASAGGVQALGILLPQLPPRFAPAVVVVLHQPADSPGLLVDVFEGRCPLPVRMAEDKQPLCSGTVVFAPPGYHTLIESDAIIALSLEAPENFSRPSIDVLFQSTAWSLRDRALGILLTGANADGAAGLASIQRAGGGAWVQDPDSAMSDAMPRSALDQGVPAEILTLHQMSDRLSFMTDDMAVQHSLAALHNNKEPFS